MRNSLTCLMFCSENFELGVNKILLLKRIYWPV